MNFARRYLMPAVLAAVSLVVSVAVLAADKAGGRIEVQSEQASIGVVVGFAVFCIIGIAAWIYYTSKSSKDQGEE